ncbi:MAG: hypothetical protein E7226_00870 [Clostridiales bacterium]|nr:hypothetical protein [Clostridiales bacterium]
MTETQKHLLKLFKEIIDICHENDIVYYMAGGTLIGVMRHGGFIPWDDDLDIMMTRDEWEKFVEICRNSLPDDRFLECQELNRDYPNTFGRYTDTSTCAIHMNEALGDGHAGYVIDIIVLDPVPDAEAHRKYMEDFMLYSDLINPTVNYSYRFNINRERYIEAFERIQRGEREAVLQELEQRMFSYKEEDCDYYVLRWGGVVFRFEKSMYGRSRWGEFEGLKCRIPDRTSDYLVQHFGDDWEFIPPHDEQASHDAVFSLDVDYKTIQDDYLPLIDVASVKDKWRDRKRFYFDCMDERFQNGQRLIGAHAELYRMEIERQCSETDHNLTQLLEEGKYDELLQFFGRHIRTLTSRPLIGREDFSGIRRFEDPIFVDPGDNILYIILMTMINRNMIAKANRLLDVREQKKGPLTEQLQQIRDFVRDYRRAVSDYDLGRQEEAVRCAETLFKAYPDNFSLAMFLSRAYIEQKMYDKAEPVINESIRKYPDEGYFLKYLGDYYKEYKADEDKAMELYHQAAGSTKNGIVLFEIDNILKGNNG